MEYNQQGDVLLFSEEFSVKGLKKVPGTLLHKGANHHHSLKGGKAQIYTNDKERFLSVSAKTTLVHEEHKPIVLPKGQYRMGLVNEYDHWLEESRKVID